jgi:hypothetical protein
VLIALVVYVTIMLIVIAYLDMFDSIIVDRRLPSGEGGMKCLGSRSFE